MMFSFYIPETGFIVQSGVYGSELEAIQDAPQGTEIVSKGSLVDRDWFDVKSGEIRPRVPLTVQEQIEATVDEAVTIIDIPEETLVWVDGELFRNEDETPVAVDETNALVLTFDTVGVWQIRLEPPFPWLPTEFKVVVS